MAIIKNIDDLPNLSGAKLIAVDTETRDPNLIEDGPGWGRGWGNLVGVSLAVEQDTWYIPLLHEVEREDNLPWEPVIAYLSDTLGTDIPKTGANCMYDYGWLMESNVKLGGIWLDVQFAEALLDPRARSYSLETLAVKYKLGHKLGDELYAWAASRYYGAATAKDQGGNIHRCPARIVGSYAEQDARLALRLLQRQIKEIYATQMQNVFNLECRLIPLLVKMRMRGLTFDPYLAQEADADLLTTQTLLEEDLYNKLGFIVNVNGRNDMAKLEQHLGVLHDYTKYVTEKGQASYTAAWLDSLAFTYPEANLVKNIRKTIKARSTFIQGSILEKAKGMNRIFPSLHPLRSDDGGAVTGRFSCSKPNGQQFPSRDEILAPIIRGVFIPEAGYTHWCKLDYSQIEYRMFAHFSEDPALCYAYRDITADFHNLVGIMLGGAVPRKLVKNYNFAMLYGAGNKRIAVMMENLFTKDDAYALCHTLDPNAKGSDIYLTLAMTLAKLYAEKFPAAKDLTNKTRAMISNYKYIETLAKRRIRFDQVTHVSERGEGGNRGHSPTGAADEEPADWYKGINYLLQGSAADFMKKGMVDAYEAGIFDKIGYPHIIVHDELGLSYHDDLRQEFIELKKIMENPYQLKVRVIMDVELGPTWGDVRDFNLTTGEFI